VPRLTPGLRRSARHWTLLSRSKWGHGSMGVIILAGYHVHTSCLMEAMLWHEFKKKKLIKQLKSVHSKLKLAVIQIVRFIR
jgi:hypothetical protein